MNLFPVSRRSCRTRYPKSTCAIPSDVNSVLNVYQMVLVATLALVLRAVFAALGCGMSVLRLVAAPQSKPLALETRSSSIRNLRK
jgi:hypothetical protein